MYMCTILQDFPWFWQIRSILGHVGFLPSAGWVLEPQEQMEELAMKAQTMRDMAGIGPNPPIETARKPRNSEVHGQKYD